MESTSHYWLALYTRLCREGYRVALLNPIQTHAMRELHNQNHTKTDEIDTLAIAETIHLGRYEPPKTSCWLYGSCVGTDTTSLTWSVT